MDAIKEEIEELITNFIIKNNNHNQIEYPSDILEALNYDAEADLKDRLWDLIKYELDYKAIFDEIEKHKEEEEEEEEIE
jgi:hypothetical protein